VLDVSQPIDYRQSGVNIDEGNRAVELIKSKVASTFSPNVLMPLGGFSGCYELPKGYDEPVLVSCTDGVGTKVKIATETGILDTVGIDLVAMCVNDLICVGAKPLYFLDYIACHELVPESMDQLVSGMVEGCKLAQCSLIGGEMAEMGDVYQKGDVDLAGFSVGIVEKKAMVTGEKIQPDHFVYGIPSSGLHSNGFSLVRKILTPELLLQESISIEEVLKPTRIYVQEVLTLIKTQKVVGLAHITGGGLIENVTRILPKGLSLDLDLSLIKVPSIFKDIQRIGAVEESEMWRVFNMGIGMVVLTKNKLKESEDLVYLGRVIL